MYTKEKQRKRCKSVIRRVRERVGFLIFCYKLFLRNVCTSDNQLLRNFKHELFYGRIQVQLSLTILITLVISVLLAMSIAFVTI